MKDTEFVSKEYNKWYRTLLKLFPKASEIWSLDFILELSIIAAIKTKFK